MFNYGLETPAYVVHYSNFAMGEVLEAPTSNEDCKKGGYADFGFKNQGQCVSSLVANR